MDGSSNIYIGTASWSIPRPDAEWFPAEGTHLERYAARFPGVEIDSSFYNFHQPQTYARWAQSTPAGFRFAFKLNRQITHEGQLTDLKRLEEFLQGPLSLGDKLGPMLVQLPPSLRFNAGDAATFFERLQDLFPGSVVCEPRHPSWFQPEVEALLARYHVARVAADPPPVAADPPPVAAADEPGGWDGLFYFRLHGSPKMYYTPYTERELQTIAPRLQERARSAPTWCIFDNTAAFAATANALMLWEMVKKAGKVNR